MSEKVTVVVLVHNGSECISESFDSIINQTYPNIEIIAVGPTTANDALKDVIEQYKEKVFWYTARKKSTGAMMNAAMSLATGEYAIRLDAGDILLPEAIRLQVDEFKADPSIGMVVTGCQIMHPDGEIQSVVDVPPFPRRALLLFLMYGYIFNRGNIMVKNECYKNVGVILFQTLFRKTRK